MPGTASFAVASSKGDVARDIYGCVTAFRPTSKEVTERCIDNPSVAVPSGVTAAASFLLGLYCFLKIRAGVIRTAIENEDAVCRSESNVLARPLRDSRLCSHVDVVINVDLQSVVDGFNHEDAAFRIEILAGHMASDAIRLWIARDNGVPVGAICLRVKRALPDSPPRPGVVRPHDFQPGECLERSVNAVGIGVAAQ